MAISRLFGSAGSAVDPPKRLETGPGEVLFPKRGASATEFLLAANLVVAAVLLITWGEGYRTHLRQWMQDAWHAVSAGEEYVRFLPTLFLHVDSRHLAANMVSLLAASGAVEFLAGARWALGTYLATGLAGAVTSYLDRGGPPLSVGASGAVFGLLGCAVAFLVRRRHLFNYAKRWKVWRVYIPLFILVFLPALAHADVSAHAGGFASGLILGAVIPPHPRVAHLGRLDSLEEIERSEPEG
jgi:rhomboid protease GluP